jgi:iron(III) transport system permease protein
LWRERTRGAVLTEFAALLLLVLPSPVIGIGLIGLWNRPATAWLYASPGLLLIGYLIQYAALAGGIAQSTLARLPPSLEQAAAVTGAGWWRRLVFIVLPLSRRGLIAAWLAAYLFCLRDTGLAMLVYPPGEDTLPVRVFTLMANSPFGLVAALCALLVAAALPPLAAFALLPRGRARSP